MYLFLLSVASKFVPVQALKLALARYRILVPILGSTLGLTPNHCSSN